jgi:hypothetical protein
MARWKDGGGLKRGQLKASCRFLATRWNWTANRVSRFLQELEAENVVKREIGGSREPTRITICDYNAYQDRRYTNKDADEYADEYKVVEEIEGSRKIEHLREEVREVFDVCNRLRGERRSRKGLSGRPLKATPKRLSKIEARRRDGFSHAELLDVPRPFYDDPWEGRDRYDDPIYAFKDDATVQGWLDKLRNGTGDGSLVDLQLVAGGGP